MPLFDVPGWSISAEPVPEPDSRKRKRPASDTGSEIQSRVHSAEINLEKLVKKLTRKRDEGDSTTHKSNSASTTFKSKSRRKKREPQSAVNLDKRNISSPMPLMKASERVTKKTKQSHDSRITEPEENSRKDSEQLDKDSDSLSGLTSMQKNMKQKLEGARFRLLNQMLYESKSEDAHRMMQADPTVYTEYHSGFRQQVLSWPTNPVDHYVGTLSSYPVKTIVADLGCGDAAIAHALIPKGISVLSFDLRSNNPWVVEADICGILPLPGSEGTEGSSSDGEAHIVDVVVFSLSLMSTNWPQSIREAWRILKPNGELKIAEVTSRFRSLEEFVSFVSSIGFKLKSKDERNTHFTLFEFKKISRKFKSPKDWVNIFTKADTLKPCEYKRRCASN
ncbi:methyltransferase-domain-containing protein [Lentinula aciculospora]|uniref:Ribosomal RNA-processing protein 8 n=1 Tax=Lentinula aciculospora TaxID=153920 RepID=A0A9W9DF52_9AGAR|nr:methyltransferase-domain-containing protein [Lentinula aciculospora]